MTYYLIEFVQNDSLEGTIINLFTQASEVVPHYSSIQTVSELQLIISKGEWIITDDSTSDGALGTGIHLKHKWTNDLGNFVVKSYSIMEARFHQGIKKIKN